MTNSADNKAYKKVSKSKWFAAWKAVELWYPYRRKMKSFYLFVEAFENNDRPRVLNLTKRFMITGSTKVAMLEAFNHLNDPKELVHNLVDDYQHNPTYLPEELKGK